MLFKKSLNFFTWFSRNSIDRGNNFACKSLSFCSYLINEQYSDLKYDVQVIDLSRELVTILTETPLIHDECIE